MILPVCCSSHSLTNNPLVRIIPCIRLDSKSKENFDFFVTFNNSGLVHLSVTDYASTCALSFCPQDPFTYRTSARHQKYPLPKTYILSTYDNPNFQSSQDKASMISFSGLPHVGSLIPSIDKAFINFAGIPLGRRTCDVCGYFTSITRDLKDFRVSMSTALDVPGHGSIETIHTQNVISSTPTFDLSVLHSSMKPTIVATRVSLHRANLRQRFYLPRITLLIACMQSETMPQSQSLGAPMFEGQAIKTLT